jgi:hypothetical protein
MFSFVFVAMISHFPFSISEATLDRIEEFVEQIRVREVSKQKKDIMTSLGHSPSPAHTPSSLSPLSTLSLPSIPSQSLSANDSLHPNRRYEPKPLPDRNPVVLTEEYEAEGENEGERERKDESGEGENQSQGGNEGWNISDGTGAVKEDDGKEAGEEKEGRSRDDEKSAHAAEKIPPPCDSDLTDDVEKMSVSDIGLSEEFLSSSSSSTTSLNSSLPLSVSVSKMLTSGLKAQILVSATMRSVDEREDEKHFNFFLFAVFSSAFPNMCLFCLSDLF